MHGENVVYISKSYVAIKYIIKIWYLTTVDFRLLVIYQLDTFVEILSKILTASFFTIASFYFDTYRVQVHATRSFL